MRFATVPLISCAAVLALGGCGVQSTAFRQPVALPADWKNAAGFPVASASRDLSRWWGRFGDPTLTKIISTALANSPDTATAAARIREARARRTGEAAALFPTLGYSTSANSSRTRRDGIGTDTGTSYSAGLNASWEVDLFGKNRNAVQAASAQVGASEENFHSVQASLASEIAIAYTNLRVGQARLDVLYDTIRSREETEELARWRTQSGEADALESSQATTSLEQARAAIPALQQSNAQASNFLALLAGKRPGDLDGLLNSRRKSIPDPPARLAIGIPADALRQRPDVRLAGYQLLAAAANTRVAEARRYPSLNLSGSLGTNTLKAGKLLNPETVTAGIVAGLAGPIFDAGRIEAEIDAQDAAQQQAYQTYRSTILTALYEVENALIACRRTAERLETLERATASAQQAADLAQQQYQAGITDILTVLDSQRSLLGLQDNLYGVRADRTTAYIQLYKALGGGWS